MNLQIDPERLKKAMDREGLSVKELARRAKISERTIARLRSGKGAGGVRPRNLTAIANALKTEAGVLTGELTEPDANRPASSVPPETRWNFRLPTAIRNAYSLVATRYGVPEARIVELAPLVFLLIAEQTLASRKQRLKQMRDAYAARTELAWQARHLPLEAAFDSVLDDIYGAEQSSIDERDLFAEALLDNKRLMAVQFYEDYDEDEHNPFAAFLRARAGELEAPAEVDKVSHYQTEYRLCREHALALTDGDEELADDILYGTLPLHELPSEFRRDDTKTARLEWFRRKAAEHHEAVRTSMSLDELL